MTGIEKPHEVLAGEVTANFFPLLGIQPMLGRGFLPEEERPESAHVVILSHAFWTDYLGRAPDALGKTLSLTTNKLGEGLSTGLHREGYTIVGIMPPGFTLSLRQIRAALDAADNYRRCDGFVSCRPCSPWRV